MASKTAFSSVPKKLDLKTLLGSFIGPQTVTETQVADLSITTDKLATGALAASAAGRGKMAAAFFAVDATSRAFFADGFLSADATGRAIMADGFVNFAKLASPLVGEFIVKAAAEQGVIIRGRAVDDENIFIVADGTTTNQWLTEAADLNIGVNGAVNFGIKASSGAHSFNGALAVPAAGDFIGQKAWTARWESDTKLRLYMRGTDNTVRMVELTLS